MRSVVTVPTAVAQEVRENPKVDELQERLVEDYPRLFSAFGKQKSTQSGSIWYRTDKLKLNPKVYRH